MLSSKVGIAARFPTEMQWLCIPPSFCRQLVFYWWWRIGSLYGHTHLRFQVFGTNTARWLGAMATRIVVSKCVSYSVSSMYALIRGLRFRLDHVQVSVTNSPLHCEYGRLFNIHNPRRSKCGGEHGHAKFEDIGIRRPIWILSHELRCHRSPWKPT